MSGKPNSWLILLDRKRFLWFWRWFLLCNFKDSKRSWSALIDLVEILIVSLAAAGAILFTFYFLIYWELLYFVYALLRRLAAVGVTGTRDDHLCLGFACTATSLLCLIRKVRHIVFLVWSTYFQECVGATWYISFLIPGGESAKDSHFSALLCGTYHFRRTSWVNHCSIDDEWITHIPSLLCVWFYQSWYLN